MNMKVRIPIIVYEDNQATIKISENDTHHDRTKHIDIKYHFIRDDIKNKLIKLEWVTTDEQVADILTKTTTGPTFIQLRNRLLHTCTDQVNNSNK
jgi:hypothetical protein